MMKKRWMKLVITAAMLCLAAALFVIPAYANFDYTCNVNRPVEMVQVFNTSGTVMSFTTGNGSLPEGLNLYSDEHGIYLQGIPKTTGLFSTVLYISTLYPTGPADEYTNVYVTVKNDFGPDPYVPSSKPTVKKSPTGETVEAGGKAIFIARADNYTSYVWRIVSEDTTSTIPATDAPQYFNGLTINQYSDENGETLILSNIPASMNGWSAECRYINSAGSSFTNGAIIKVNARAVTTPTPAPSSGPRTPVIETNPRTATQELGSSVTLSVGAASTDGGQLRYQWFSGPDSSIDSMTKLPGEESSSLTIKEDRNDGTVYYCAGVINYKDGKYSDIVYSDGVAVTFTRPEGYVEPPEEPEPTETTESTETGDPASQPIQTPEVIRESEDGTEESGLSTTIIFFAVTGLLALVALVVVIILLKKTGGDDD